MAPHSSTLAWKIPWMEEPGGLQSMGSLRVGHDWTTSLSLFTFMHWRRKWQPTPVFLPGESQRWGSLVDCHLWVAQSRTRLKRLAAAAADGAGCLIFIFWVLSFMPAFSLSSFTFIKRLFSFSPWRHFLFPFLSFLYHEGPHFNNVV